MGFSAEMKAFLGAYKTGQSINASRTDQDYKEQRTASEKAKMERDNDPETLQTAKELQNTTLARAKQSLTQGAATHASGLQTAATQRELLNLRMDMARHPEKYANNTGGAPTGTGVLPAENPVGPDGPLPRGQGALPIVAPKLAIPQPVTTPAEVDPFPPGSDFNPTGGYFSEGGFVDDEEGDPSIPDEAMPTQGVLPASPIAAPANAPTDVSARRREQAVQPVKGIEGIVAPGVVRDAVKAGMTFGARESGLANGGAVASPRTMAVARQIAAGAGGLSEEEMAQAKKAVDPEGQLTESQRNMAALGSVYQYWANQGEPKKAEKVAFQMLQYYRNASQRYAAIAAKAAEGGNIDLATKAALKAYQNVPDGNDMHMERNEDGTLTYVMTGPKGETIRQGIATPQQLAASAMGMASGGFDKALLSAAGAHEASQGAGGAVGGRGTSGGKTQSAGDRAKEEETAMGAVDALKTKWMEDEATKKLKPEELKAAEAGWEQMGNLATHIMQQNKVTSKEAARAADILINPVNAGKNGKADFKLAMGDDGTNTITMGNGMKFTLDDNQLDQVQNARALRIKSAADKEAAAKAEAEKPGIMGTFIEKATPGAKAAGAIVSADYGKFKGELSDVGDRILSSVPEEFKDRAKSAVATAVKAGGDAGMYMLKLIADDLKGDGGIRPDQVGRDIVGAAKGVAGAVQNKGAIPVNEEDRPL